MNGEGRVVNDDYCVGNVTSGTIRTPVISLESETTYYYRAFVAEYNASTYTVEYRYGEVKHFTTGKVEEYIQQGWLELPAMKTGSNLYNGSFGSGKSRNYSYLYDKSMYTALWTAYPLTKSHISGSADSKTWNYNPELGESVQINVKSNSYETNYGNKTYSRGHQIPAADRKSNDSMRKQTYYLTNQTPQNQDGFNSPMWSNLEDAIRDLTSSTDTVYVVTGAAFQKVGENKTINYLHAAKDEVYPKDVPIPNYYWKVILKVKRNSSTNAITDACAVAVWMPHSSYSSQTAWQGYVYSVRKIEEWTGFDFFAYLPEALVERAETNSSWSTFSSF